MMRPGIAPRPFRIVQPWGRDKARQATIISRHATAAEAFREINRLLSEMVQTGSPSDSVEFVVVDAEDRVVPSERDRRRTERVSFEPPSIRLDGAREGILVDLSEGGALLETSLAPPQDRPIAVEIEWKNTSVPLQARVARSVPRQVQLESATLVRTEYCVALEFLNMTPEQSTAVRLIIQGN